MPRIIANIVARNESANYLIPVLDRLVEQVDEIVFTDDASDDNTAEIAARYTNHIQVMPEPLFATHEGAFRQKSWNFLEDTMRPTTHDWILAIDADELLYEDTPGNLRRITEQTQYEVANIWFHHMWNETHYRNDGGWRSHGSTRLFKYEHGGKFKESALACGSEPTYVAWKSWAMPGLFLLDSGLRMKHLSYIKDEDKQIKYERYTRLDGGAFHAGSHIQSIVDPIERVALEEWTWK